MAAHGRWIEIPDALGERLDRIPGSTMVRRRVALEHAINAALDAAGWPTGPRGEVQVPTAWWYVLVRTPSGRLYGHVGPIGGEDKARSVVQSWRAAGWAASRSRQPFGRPLTDAY